MERPACNECRGTTTAVRASVSRRPEGRQPPRRGLIARFMGALGDGRFFWGFFVVRAILPFSGAPDGRCLHTQNQEKEGERDGGGAPSSETVPCNVNAENATVRMPSAAQSVVHATPGRRVDGDGGVHHHATALPLTASTTAGTPALAATLATIPTTNPAAAGTTSHPQPPLCLRAGFGRGGCTHK